MLSQPYVENAHTNEILITSQCVLSRRQFHMCTKRWQQKEK